MKTNFSNPVSGSLKVVVLGGTGLIGRKVINFLREKGHDAVAASPSLGVNTLTGEGLAEILTGAQVVVDVTNSPSFEDKAVLEFFQTSTRNVLAAEAAAGVGHHVALSIVGIERLPDSGYFRAKVAQEALIRGSSIPFSIVRATQFFEFVAGIANSSMSGETVHLPDALLQPIFSEDVAATVAQAAVSEPLNDAIEVGGPEALPMAEVVRQYLTAQGDSRTIVSDAQGRYFGAALSERSLVPEENSLRGAVSFQEWLRRNVSRA